MWLSLCCVNVCEFEACYFVGVMIPTIKTTYFWLLIDISERIVRAFGVLFSAKRGVFECAYLIF